MHVWCMNDSVGYCFVSQHVHKPPWCGVCFVSRLRHTHHVCIIIPNSQPQPNKGTLYWQQLAPCESEDQESYEETLTLSSIVQACLYMISFPSKKLYLTDWSFILTIHNVCLKLNRAMDLYKYCRYLYRSQTFIHQLLKPISNSFVWHKIKSTIYDFIIKMCSFQFNYNWQHQSMYSILYT